MAKTFEEESEEKKILSDWINKFIHDNVYEGTIRDWKDIDWTTLLTRRQLRELKRRLEG